MKPTIPNPAAAMALQKCLLAITREIQGAVETNDALSLSIALSEIGSLGEQSMMLLQTVFRNSPSDLEALRIYATDNEEEFNGIAERYNKLVASMAIEMIHSLTGGATK